MQFYFIGYALSDSNGEKKPVDELRERIAAKFGVQAALKTVPHVTLVRPFETDQHDVLVERMRTLAAKEKPFTVPLTKFTQFPKSRVWCIDAGQPQDLLSLKDWFRQLAMNVWKREQIAQEYESHFHVTLSFKDVTPEVHPKIGEMLKGETLPITSLNVNTISLFKHRGTGQGWDVVETFPFGT